MKKEDFISWLIELANENRTRAVEAATSSKPNAFSLSCYFDGYADALLFASRYLERVEEG